MYCITVVLVNCSALRDSYRNKSMKEQNTQKIGERHRKSISKKTNSNEFDG
jgi:gluconate kinase